MKKGFDQQLQHLYSLKPHSLKMNKEVEPEEDPYGYMLDECKISSSQELYLQNCPFAGQSQVFPDYDSDIWLSTDDDDDYDTKLERIFMISPPESPKDNEVFQTPLEGSIASEEKETPTAPVDSIPAREKLGVSNSRVVSQKSKEVSPGLGKLPASLSFGRKVNVKGRQEMDTPAKRDEKLKALLDTLQMYDGQNNGVSASESKQVDLLKTVKKQGMTFSRPRWWTPEEEEEEEGFDD